jgi:3-hydroxy acid dehydrogenase/malonic semialdehyde reductase
MANKSHLALITGATAGIGKAVAEKLAESGMDLIITGRRKDRLAAVQLQLESKFKVKVQALAFDIQNRKQVETALKSLGDLAGKVDILINNAGLALGTSKVQDADLADWDTMIDTNIKGLLYLTRFFAPLFIKNGRGHIVNLGSVAGRWVYPGGSVYCATKHAVKAISEGARMDFFGTPIRVTNIEPGLVETEFSEVRLRDPEKAKAVYKGFKPLSAADIAECIQWCVLRPQHINIQEIVIFPTAQAAISMVDRSN